MFLVCVCVCVCVCVRVCACVTLGLCRMLELCQWLLQDPDPVALDALVRLLRSNDAWSSESNRTAVAMKTASLLATCLHQRTFPVT